MVEHLLCVQLCFSFAFSFQFFTRLGSVFAEEVGGYFFVNYHFFFVTQK